MKCENCDKEHDASFATGRFCSKKCSRSFSTKYKRLDINEKVSVTIRSKMTDNFINMCEKCLNTFNSSSKFKIGRRVHCDDCKRKTNSVNIEEVNSITELSTRTVIKIFQRLEVGCSNCGWKEGSCDLHHINGRNIENFDHHNNLCYLCPNCHRLVHTKKLKKENLINLQQFIGDTWKEQYNKRK